MSKRGIAAVAALMAVSLAVLGPTTAEAQQVRPSQGEADEAEEAGVDWQWDLRVRPRLEGRFNHRFGLEADEVRYGPGTEHSDAFSQQTRLGVRATRGALTGEAVAQHTALWGVFGGNELTMPPLNLYRAWLRYDRGAPVFLDIGRFELAYGDERVLGAVGWSQVGRAWDGMRVGIRPVDDIQVDLFGARYDDAQAGFLSGDSFLSGAYGMWEPEAVDFLDAVDLYGLYDLQWGDPEGPERRQIIMFGSRVAAGVADLDATVEGGYQFGLRCPIEEGVDGCAGPRADIRAYFFDVELGYSLNDFRPFVGFSQASGDDDDPDVARSYTQLYPTGHKWLGFMDIIGPRTNIEEIRAGVNFNVAGGATIVAIHNFTRLQPERERVGTELNFKRFMTLSEAFTIGLGYGLFMPGPGVSTTDADPNILAHWGFVQAVGSF